MSQEIFKFDALSYDVLADQKKLGSVFVEVPVHNEVNDQKVTLILPVSTQA